MPAEAAAPAEGAPPRRPRVALVLSGGGARGLSHVGVIAELEARGVPIDLVVGTSVGAVVGGLYAAGLSPAEIEDKLLHADWRAVLRGRPGRDSLSFRRKRDDSRYLLDLEAGFRNGRLIPPASVVPSYELDLLLEQLAWPAREVTDFDRLPIPYRAVAADLLTAREVVISDGSLARAMRASAAIPGVFSPVARDGHLLVDGGVLDNLPVSVARDLGAEYVIAVNAAISLAPAERLGSVTAIAAQATMLASQARTNAESAAADLLISPDLEGAGSFSFEQGAWLIERGAQAVAAHDAALAALIARYGPAGERSVAGTSLPTVAAIEISGSARVDERRIRARIRSALGQPLDLDVLHEDLGRIHEIGEFASVGFSLEPAASGTVLHLEVNEKPWGPSYLRFGPRLNVDVEGASSVGGLFSYTRTELDALGGELRLDALLGRSRGLGGELYQPLRFDGLLFVAAGFEGRQDVQDFWSGGERVAEYRFDSATATVDLGSQLGRQGEWRLGLSRGHLDARRLIGGLELPEGGVPTAGVRFQLSVDQLDNVNVPRRGQIFHLAGFRSLDELGAGDEYDKAEALYGRFFSRGRFTVFAMADAATSDDLPIYDLFVRGGMLSFSGFGEGELRGGAVAILRAGGYARLAALPAGLGTGVYAGGWLEAGNVWLLPADASVDDLLYGATAALLLDTRLGPLFVTYGYAAEGRGRVQVVLGPRF